MSEKQEGDSFSGSVWQWTFWFPVHRGLNHSNLDWRLTLIWEFLSFPTVWGWEKVKELYDNLPVVSWAIATWLIWPYMSPCIAIPHDIKLKCNRLWNRKFDKKHSSSLFLGMFPPSMSSNLIKELHSIFSLEK